MYRGYSAITHAEKATRYEFPRDLCTNFAHGATEHLCKILQELPFKVDCFGLSIEQVISRQL